MQACVGICGQMYHSQNTSLPGKSNPSALTCNFIDGSPASEATDCYSRQGDRPLKGPVKGPIKGNNSFFKINLFN